MKQVYIASRFNNATLVKVFMLKVFTLPGGDKILFTNTWQDEEPPTKLDSSYARSVAARDLWNIDNADEVWVLTEDCERVPGGMHFETGYAYATGKRIIVIGPRVNIFHHLPYMETWDSIPKFLMHFEEATNGN